MTVWYASDLHLGHSRVASLRNFASPDDHDAHLIRNWNRYVEPGDIVWVLGDVTLSASHLHKVAALNGTKHLITGNHDAVFPHHRDSHKHQREWLRYFESVQSFARRRADDVEFLMSHFPYSGDRGEERYVQYRLRDEGALLLHGHLHSPFARQPDAYPRQVHVGLDAWGMAPAEEHSVLALLRQAESDFMDAAPWMAA